MAGLGKLTTGQVRTIGVQDLMVSNPYMTAEELAEEFRGLLGDAYNPKLQAEIANDTIGTGTSDIGTGTSGVIEWSYSQTPRCRSLPTDTALPKPGTSLSTMVTMVSKTRRLP